MPTISQLPAAETVSADDLLPLSQSGSAHAVSVGTLLSQMQPAINIAHGNLLGRSSIGSGGPDPIAVGTGLILNNGVLQASPFDPTRLTTQGTISPADQALIVNGSTPQLVALAQFRSLFSAGSNITIDGSGTISANVTAGGSPSLASLTLVSSLSSGDLVGISKDGQDGAIPYGNFLDGVSIDMATAANAAADGDTFWVAQSGATLLRQTFSALWVWLESKLGTWQRPVAELNANTVLDPTGHNNAILVCSAPIQISTATGTLGSGFSCTVLNVSGGLVSFASGILTPTGSGTLGPNQSCMIYGVTYSGGTIAVTSSSSVTSTLAVPGQVTGLNQTSITASAVGLAWSAPTSGGPVSVYVIQYRASGASSWSTAGQTAGTTSFAVTSLQPATSYDFNIVAENGSGSGTPSSTLTITTASAVPVPSAPTNLAVSAITNNSVTCAWSAGATSPGGTTFSVQYRISGASTWTTAVSNTSSTSASVTGLTANTAYQVQVIPSDSAGVGPASSPVSFTTSQTPGLVTSIVWNLVPTGGYTHGSGAIGVNVHVSPATAPVRFGFSTSQSSPPASWTAGIAVNTDLWGAYAPTPATAGTYYAWAEGTDGSSPTVYATPFSVV